MTDAEIEKIYQKEKKSGVKLAARTFVLIILLASATVMVAFQKYILILIPVALTALLFVYCNKHPLEQTNVLLEILMPDEVHRYFGGKTSFRHDRGFTKRELIELSFFKEKWNRFSSSNFLKVTKGREVIKAADVELRNEFYIQDTYGRRQKKIQVVFKGILIELDGLKKFSEDEITLVKEKRTFLQKEEKGSFEMESIDFNTMFKVISVNGHNTFYILSPRAIENLVTLGRNFEKDAMYLLFKEQKAFIAINNESSIIKDVSLKKGVKTARRTIDKNLYTIKHVKKIIEEGET